MTGLSGLSLRILDLHFLLLIGLDTWEARLQVRNVSLLGVPGGVVAKLPGLFLV